MWNSAPVEIHQAPSLMARKPTKYFEMPTGSKKRNIIVILLYCQISLATCSQVFHTGSLQIV